MNTTYNIKNFRVFGERGAEAKIAPVTILTGCNSSGKSSITKSILLLDNYLHKAKIASGNTYKDVFELSNHTMDFTDYPLNLLGRFDKVINSSSSSGEIGFRYTTDNHLEVVLMFATNKADVLNRGYLKSLAILKEGIPVFRSEGGTCYLNTIPFLTEYLESMRKNLYSGPDQIIYDDVNFTNFNSWEYELRTNVSYDTIAWAIENGTLFKVSILDKIGMLEKNNFQASMDEILAPAYNNMPGIKAYIKYISEVFIESECSSFIDLFKLWEKDWMSCLSNEENLECEKFLLCPKDWSHVYSDCTILCHRWSELMDKLSKNEVRCDFIETIQNAKIRFPLLLTTLISVGEMIGFTQDNEFSKTGLYNPSGDILDLTTYYIWEDFKRCVNEQLKNALIQAWCGNLSYVGSSRIDVKRLYTLDSKTDFTLLLNRYFNARRDFVCWNKCKYNKDYEPDTFMNKWLKIFGISDSVTFDLDPEGLGVLIKLHKGNKDILLADEGYGITQLFFILLEIETEIQNAFNHPIYERWSSKNYVYVIDAHADNPEQTIIIEEPEIHLHPKFQSLLVDLFAEAYEKYNIHFIIETHSEYLIRRLQLRVAEKKISADEVSVIYVDQNNHPYNMGLSNNGKFACEFGTGFLDEADNAAIQLFDLTNE